MLLNVDAIAVDAESEQLATTESALPAVVLTATANVAGVVFVVDAVATLAAVAAPAAAE